MVFRFRHGQGFLNHIGSVGRRPTRKKVTGPLSVGPMRLRPEVRGAPPEKTKTQAQRENRARCGAYEGCLTALGNTERQTIGLWVEHTTRKATLLLCRRCALTAGAARTAGVASPPEPKGSAFGGVGKPHVERGERASRRNEEQCRSISKVGLAGQRRDT